MSEHHTQKASLVGTDLADRVRRFDEVDSTNTLALACREEGVVFLANAQRAGRGRRGATWQSAPGLGLWCSIVVAGPPRGLSMVAGLAARDALAAYGPVALKWPNDLLLADRKLGGILVEHRQGWNAVGIGINVLHTPDDFPETLRETATSLAQYSKELPENEVLLEKIVQTFDGWLCALRLENGYAAVRDAWVDGCQILGRKIQRGAIMGEVVEVDVEGALLVGTGAGLVRVDHGAIEYCTEENTCCS